MTRRFRVAVLSVLCFILLGASVLASEEAALLRAHKGSRGYMTSPGELAVIKEKAEQGLEPYRSAVRAMLTYEANLAWTYGTISGEQACQETLEPAYIGRGSPVVYAKALAYHLTGDEPYAATVRELILDLIDTTGYGDEFSGGNQCILNLSWYIPGWIWAADLIEDYPGWTSADKLAFQRWLIEEVYLKTSWASDARDNNWGAAASYTSVAISDYVHDSGLQLVDWLGRTWSPAESYAHHNAQQFSRINGTASQMDSRCPESGIRPHGGLPDELRRGSSGCTAQWIVANDASWTYTQVYLQGLVAHAELLYRRGDSSLYTNIQPDGSGSILRAINFVIDNPINPGKSTYFRHNHMPVLELAYRFYRTEAMCAQLHCTDPARRFIGTASGQLLHYGTITHGFHPDENPGPPPTVAPPAAVETASDASNKGSPRTIDVPLLGDALVEMGERAGTNFGGFRLLRAKSNSSKNREIFLQFDLSAVPARFDSAILRLYGSTDNAGEIGVHAVRDDLWREDEITWNQRPEFGERLDSILVGTDEQWWEFDVTEFVRERRAASRERVSLAVVSAASGVTLAQFHSSNNSSGFSPALIVSH